MDAVDGIQEYVDNSDGKRQEELEPNPTSDYVTPNGLDQHENIDISDEEHETREAPIEDGLVKQENSFATQDRTPETQYIMSEKQDLLYEEDLTSEDGDLISQDPDLISHEQDLISQDPDLISHEQDLISQGQYSMQGTDEHGGEMIEVTDDENARQTKTYEPEPQENIDHLTEKEQLAYLRQKLTETQAKLSETQVQLAKAEEKIAKLEGRAPEKKFKYQTRIEQHTKAILEKLQSSKDGDKHLDRGKKSHGKKSKHKGQSVYESKPKESTADAGITFVRSGSMAPAKCVFESEPKKVIPVDYKAGEKAPDFGSAAKCVFESTPMESRAEFKAGKQIQTLQAGSVFESQPKASTATVRYGDSFFNRSNSGVFESKPAESPYVRYDSKPVCSNTPTIFESVPAESKASISWNSTVQSSTAKSVFENVPAIPKVSASAIRELTSSSDGSYSSEGSDVEAQE